MYSHTGALYNAMHCTHTMATFVQKVFQTTLLESQSEWPKDKPFLLMHSRHARNSYDSKIKNKFQIVWSFFEIFPFIRFGIAWTSRINLKKNLGYDIKYLSIWAFMGYACFPTEKVSKVTFILFCQKNSHGLFSFIRPRPCDLKTDK